MNEFFGGGHGHSGGGHSGGHLGGHSGHGRWFGPSRPYYGGIYGGGYPVYGNYLNYDYDNYPTSNVCVPITGREVCPLNVPVKRRIFVNGIPVWRCCDY
jgi:hypothetical protein